MVVYNVEYDKVICAMKKSNPGKEMEGGEFQAQGTTSAKAQKGKAL